MRHTAAIGRRSVFNRKLVDIFYPRQTAAFKGNAFLPGVAVIPLKQCDGSAARPILSPGTFVREGQVIAVADGMRSAAVHASVPGILRGYKSMPLMDGSAERAAVIQLAGTFDISGKQKNAFAWEGAPAGMLMRSVEEFGLIHTMDRPVPLSFSLRKFIADFSAKAPPESSEGITGSGILAVRMFDKDPSCYTDDFLVETRLDDVLRGCAIIAKILDVRKICFLHRNVASFFRTDVSGFFPHAAVEVRQTAVNVYPGGNGFLCASEAARIFQAGDAAGVFCADPWTAFSVFDSVCFGKPTLHKPVLVAGSAIGKPGILNVRIGTRIGDIIEECGGFKFPPAKIIANGLLAGNAVYDLDTPIDQSTKSLHFMGKNECPPYTVHACIHCGKCLRICPQKLDPVRLAYGVRNNPGRRIPDASKCIFCGSCAAVCPSRIPLHHIIQSSLSEELPGGAQ